MRHSVGTAHRHYVQYNTIRSSMSSLLKYLWAVFNYVAVTAVHGDLSCQNFVFSVLRKDRQSEREMEEGRC
jgi:hypothetical protein